MHGHVKIFEQRKGSGNVRNRSLQKRRNFEGSAGRCFEFRPVGNPYSGRRGGGCGSKKPQKVKVQICAERKGFTSDKVLLIVSKSEFGCRTAVQGGEDIVDVCNSRILIVPDFLHNAFCGGRVVMESGCILEFLQCIHSLQ